MIKDSCYCGAEFTVTGGASGETKDHERWLKHHERCREAFILQRLTVQKEHNDSLVFRCRSKAED